MKTVQRPAKITKSGALPVNRPSEPADLSGQKKSSPSSVGAEMKPSYAAAYAKARRMQVFSEADGHELSRLLALAGVKEKSRGDKHFHVFSFNAGQYVVAHPPEESGTTSREA